MQLTIKATGENAKYLSHLLAKNPNNLYDREVKGSRVRIVYTTFTDEEVEVLIYVTLDSIDLVRNNQSVADITQYVNDREFAVSSLFFSNIRSALGTALNGKPKEEYIEWVDYKFNLEIGIGPLASSFSNERINDLFVPLGYEVEIESEAINYSFVMKHRSSARYLTLKGNATLQNALRHLFILIPVLDDYKHYYLDEKEIEKLERYGESWLDSHPLKEFIIKNTLRFRELIDKANLHLESINVEEEGKTEDDDLLPIEPKVRLNDLRYQVIIEAIKSIPEHEKIVDLGSGEGKFSVKLGFIDGVKEILSVEPSEIAQLRAINRFDKAKINEAFVVPNILLGSLFYCDERLRNKDVIVLSEVIEHIDEARLPKIMKTIFTQYLPKVLIVSTPNSEYNAVYDLEGKMRHSDHRFEWTREDFHKWCATLSDKYNYKYSIKGIGEYHEQFGYPTQMCIFARKDLD